MNSVQLRNPSAGILFQNDTNLTLANIGLVVAIGWIVFVPGIALGQYSILDLGDLGNSFARARAVNESGQVAGEATIPAPILTTIDRAVLWQTGGITDLGTLGGQQSAAFAINSSGTVGGWAQTAAGNKAPTLWVGGMTFALPTLGGASGTAWGLNDAGVAVGNSYLNSSVYHATLWSGATVTDLGTLGGAYSVAYDINNHGSVVGSANDNLGRERAVLWGEGGASDLGGLSGGSWTAARAVNDVGQVIFWGTPQGATANRAAFWDGNSASPVIELGTFGGAESWAYGLNNYGFVVGSAQFADTTSHAFVWDGVEQIDLGTLGGFYSSAYGINDQGVIVGFAHDALGSTHAVAWMPIPEPSGLLCFLLGSGIMGGWITRRRRLLRSSSPRKVNTRGDYLGQAGLESLQTQEP